MVFRNLKIAIIQYTSANYGRTPTQDNILVTVGAKQALFNTLIGIINPGDEVILLAPYWVSYPEMVKMVGGIPNNCNARARSISIMILMRSEKAANKNTKAIILNSPNNPSGVVYSPEFIKRDRVIFVNRRVFI